MNQKMTDLIERLRAGAGGGKHWMDLHTEAADEIERLRGEAGVMRQLLHLALGVIEDCYPDDSTEAEMMQDLENQIKAVFLKNQLICAGPTSATPQSAS